MRWLVGPCEARSDRHWRAAPATGPLHAFFCDHVTLPPVVPLPSPAPAPIPPCKVQQLNVRCLLFFSAGFLESAKSHDSCVLVRLDDKQVFVARDKGVSVPRNNQTQNHQVVGIPADTRLDVPGVKYQGIGTEDVHVLSDDGRWGLDLEPELVLDPVENALAQDQLMVLQTEFDDGFASTAGGRSRNSDVGIKNDPHDRALKTSSPVRNP